jgi:hypothetical protein
VSRWYRAYEGTVTDAKLAEAAMVAEVSRSVSIAAWHCLLESAAAQNNCGTFDTSARRVAVILYEPPSKIEALFAAFAELGLIVEGALSAWSRRQYESDSSTERSRKHRETKRNGDATLQQPNATPPETETEAKREKKEAIASCLRAAWPCPDGVEADHWRDFRRNRKTKRMTDSETAYQGQLRELEKLSDDEWPPGRLVQHAAEKGWGSICDPRTPRNGQSANNVTSLRGTRPDPALDLLRAARAAENGEADRGARTTLPAIRSG